MLLCSDIVQEERGEGEHPTEGVSTEGVGPFFTVKVVSMVDEAICDQKQLPSLARHGSVGPSERDSPDPNCSFSLTA